MTSEPTIKEVEHLILEAISYKGYELQELLEAKSASLTDNQQKEGMLKVEKKMSEIDACKELLEKIDSLRPKKPKKTIDPGQIEGSRL